MKIKKIFLPIIVLFFLITACNDDDLLPINSILNVLGVSSSNDDVVCLFRICSWHRWHRDFNSQGNYGSWYLSSNNYCWAYISDGFQFVNPASINCNGVPMIRLEDGQFEYHNNVGHLSLINWNIINMLGATYNETDTNLPMIDFTSIRNGDTINVSQGLNIQYTGTVDGIDSILVTFDYNYYVGYSNEVNYYRFEKLFPNDGNIVLTANDLQYFPVSTIDATFLASGSIELFHKKYVEEEFNGRTIAKVYETSMLIWATFVR